MQVRISHRTTYRYQEAVKYTAQTLRLTPRRDGEQRTLSWSIHAPGRRAEQVDAHGNITHLLTLEEPHREISIVVAGVVEIARARDVLREQGRLSPLAYLAPTALTAASDRIVALAREHLEGHGSLRQRLYELAKGVCASVQYHPGTTTVEDAAAAALERGEGVCQDQAHVLIACCRSMGVPARYVSGYLCSRHAEEIASHAWVEAWLTEAQGWHGIDVTHVEPAGEGHCRLAVGRDYLDAAPVRGVRRGGGPEVMNVSVTATSLDAQ
ncbi:MAG TPA: transglutaminase family protein [Steroidobacteraceae bacterium]|jgi:transglutaminase-like putative cysteine protease|nr:transglutaminase family protein [Steroidobacteraceae bacterium]